MCKPTTLGVLLFSCVLLVGLPLEPAQATTFTTAAAALEDNPHETIEGVLTAVWGDPPPGSVGAPHLRFQLTDVQGWTRPLTIPPEVLEEAGGLVAVDRRWVEVAVPQEASVGFRTPAPLEAQSLRVVVPPASRSAQVESARRDVLGSKPWVTISCKFSDIADEPEDLAFFQGMYDNAPGRLDHYWREVSYDLINIVGSTAFDWVTLPNVQTFYAPTPGSGSSSNLTALFNDCTAAADPFVDFSNGGTPFEGINMMFNGLLDCCAWGGSRFATLDGITKSWRVTWEPPWGYRDEGVIAHEMGHGFGLPHENNSDQDSSPYDSPWDVMSAATSFSVDDPTYGDLGKHIVSYHKDVLGWIAADERFEVSDDGVFTVDIDPLGRADTDAYRMAKIPIGGSASHYYTIEVREAVGQYEGELPGTGSGDRVVILHEVLTSRTEPAWVLDADDPPATFSSTEGVMWREGEVFVDPAEELTVTILAPTTTGYRVRIQKGGAMFTDGFESGDASAWSSSVP